MKNVLKYLLACCLFLGQAWHVAAQTPCYKTYRDQGLKYMRQGNNVLAVAQFFGALKTCDDIPENNDLYDLIEKANQAEITRLEIIIKKEQKALLAADSAREIATQARQLESVARVQAEQNARKAREQGRIAESLRLSLLADMAREKGETSEALQLALLGWYLSDNKPVAMRAFGAAVRDSLTRKLMPSQSALDWIGNPVSSGAILAKNADQELYLVNPNTGENTLLSAKKKDRLYVIASASGRHFLTWSGGEPIQVWDADGKPLARLQGHSEPVRNAAFSADDSLLATCGRDNTVRLWTLDGRLLGTHNKHGSNVYEVLFSSDGKHVFSRSSDGTPFAWDISANQVTPLGNDHVYLYDLSIADFPETTVATADASGTIGIWSKNGLLKAEKKINEGPVLETGFCPNTQLLSAITASGKVFIWNTEQDNLKNLHSQDSIKGMAWSPKGNHLLGWSTAQELSLWDAGGELIRHLPGFGGGTASAAFSGDGMYILVTGRSGAVKLIDLEGNIQMEWPADKNGRASLLPDGKHLLLFSDNHLSICPLAAWTLSQYGDLTRRDDPATVALIAKYHIQFFEESR